MIDSFSTKSVCVQRKAQSINVFSVAHAICYLHERGSGANEAKRPTVSVRFVSCLQIQVFV